MAGVPSVGEEFAGYRIDELIGRGGMGVVYRARDLSLGRNVALKLLSPELAEQEGFRQRFIRESRLAVAIDHPNIIPIYEAREADGTLFIAMRYVEGSDLRRILESKKRLEPDETNSLLRQTASALDAAHLQGLVHRDVKPGNILVVPRSGLDETDHVYLSDFGLTKRIRSGSALTRTGQLVGTIDYVAPEMISGGAVDGRADQYALGCVAFECLTGSIPFPRDDEMAVLWAHVQGEIPRATAVRPELPSGVDELFARVLAKSPDDRYPSCGAFASDLAKHLHVERSTPPTRTAIPPPPTRVSPPSPPPATGRKRRRWMIPAGGGVVAAAVAVALVVTLSGNNATTQTTGPPEGNADCTAFASAAGNDDAAGTAAQPLATVEALVARLRPGQTGCLQGTFTIGRLVIRQPNVVLRSADSTRARLLGAIDVAANDVTIEDLRIDGKTGGAGATVTARGVDGLRFLRNDLTNDQTSGTCLYLDAAEGQPTTAPKDVVVAGNSIHDCGPPSDPHKGPGIAINAASGALVENNFIYDTNGPGIQMYPNAQGTVIQFNTLVRDFQGVQFGGDSTGASSNNVMKDNVVAFAGTNSIASNFEGALGTGNNVIDNCTGLAVGMDIYPKTEASRGFTVQRANHLDIDPQLANPEGHPPDFTVQNPLCSGFGVRIGGIKVDGRLVLPLLPA